eukprot:scaffold79099_cov34-Phaeocystis_antarctica.AAC.3
MWETTAATRMTATRTRKTTSKLPQPPAPDFVAWLDPPFGANGAGRHIWQRPVSGNRICASVALADYLHAGMAPAVMSILLVGPPPWEKKPLRGRIGSSTLEPVAGWVFTEDFYVLSNRAGTYQGRASSDQH